MTARNIKRSFRRALLRELQWNTFLTILPVICVWFPPRLDLNTFFFYSQSLYSWSKGLLSHLHNFSLGSFRTIWQDILADFCGRFPSTPRPPSPTLEYNMQQNALILSACIFFVSINPSNHQRNQDIEHSSTTEGFFWCPAPV